MKLTVFINPAIYDDRGHTSKEEKNSFFKRNVPICLRSLSTVGFMELTSAAFLHILILFGSVLFYISGYTKIIYYITVYLNARIGGILTAGHD